MEDKTYNADNLPDDAEVGTLPPKEFNAIDPSETYTVQILKADLKDNLFYKPDAPDPKDRGQKYQLNFEFVILDEGEFYGRRVWDNASLFMKPTGKKGPTKLYKIVTSALKSEMTWDECALYAPEIKSLYRHLQEQVVGAQVKIAIENIVNPDSKKVRTKVVSYNMVKSGKDLPAFDPEKAKIVSEEKNTDKELEELFGLDYPPYKLI